MTRGGPNIGNCKYKAKNETQKFDTLQASLAFGVFSCVLSHEWKFFILTELKSGSHLPKKYIFICFNESSLKMMKNAFYFILEVFFVLKIFKFLPWLSGHAAKMAWLER